MGPPPRLAGLAVLALLTGCSGSVADADDGPRPRRTQAVHASGFCIAVQANTAAARPLRGLVARGSGPTDELVGLVTEVRRTNIDLVATAPGEIRSDVERAVQVSNLQLDALEAGGTAAARNPELVARLESPEFVSAGERVESYVAENC
jgi:hypothetical protein